MRDMLPLLINTDFPPIRRFAISTLQANLGYLCNLSCTHCHVNAGPNRTELMDEATIDLVLQVLSHLDIETLDLTGGSPEMNPHFCDLVERASSAGIRVLDRCNPTILVEPGYEQDGDRRTGFHGGGGNCDIRNSFAYFICAESFHGSNAIHTRKSNIHQDQVLWKYELESNFR